MKATILSVAPEVRMVDITHMVGAQDLMEAAFHLKSSFAYFPKGTVHVAVVDPGVGSTRKPVALQLGDYFFVGPDNGIFALVLDGSEPDDVVVLDKPAFWATETPSQTFHGRDIFGPIAAHLSNGVRLRDVGTPVESMQRLHWALPIADEQGIQGWVVHIDRFGNCITNIHKDTFDSVFDGRTIKSYAGSGIISGIHNTYSSVETDEPVVLFGSHGFLEIAVNQGSAAETISIQKGQPINLVFIDQPENVVHES